MRELNVCPSTLHPGHSTYSPAAVKTLFDGKAVSHIFAGGNPEKSEEDGGAAIRNAGRISLSGAQPKFSIVVGEDNKLRFTNEGETGTFILKPRPTGLHIINKGDCAANEHVTMQIASQVYHIDTAANALCFFNDGEPAYITRRFDVHDKGKYKQEDFAALLGYSKDNGGVNYKYDKVSYEECAEIIRKYVKAAPIDIRRFYQLILFNFITLNDDAHLKNFSLIERNGEYRLSPAYDLVNTNLHLSEPHIFALEKGLLKNGGSLNNPANLGRSVFEEFGRRIGLNERVIKRDIDFFSSEQPRVRELLELSFLSDKLKKGYWDGYSYRRKMLNF